MNRAPGRHRELAERLADRFPTAADIDRIAEAVGLSLGEIARHPRPVDHWSAAIAEAIEHGLVGRLLEHVAPQLAAFDRARFAMLADPVRPSTRPSLHLSLDWEDLEEERPWRVEDGGKRCPALATVRVFGGPAGQRPRFAWRPRWLAARGRWQEVELEPVGDTSPGFSVWRTTTAIELGRVRAWRLEARTALDDQEVRISHLLVPLAGLRASAVALLLMIIFAGLWLFPLPALGVAFGLGAALVTVGLAVVRGLLMHASSRGPLFGLGPVERSVPLAIVAALAVVVAPRLLLVIVENTTRAPVNVRTLNRDVVSFAPGEGRTLMSWDRALRSLDSDMCVCPAQTRQADPSCPCRPEWVRGVEVLHVQCLRRPWEGLGPIATQGTLRNVELREGVVWRQSDETCKPLDWTASFPLAQLPGNEGAEGTVTVRYPWRSDLAPIALTPAAIARDVTITGQASMTIEGLTSAQPVTVPAIDPASPSIKIELGGNEGEVSCEHANGPIEVVGFDVPARSQVVVKGAVESSWNSKGSTRGRACVRPGAPVERLEITAPSLTAGTTLKLPAQLAAGRVVVKTQRREVSSPGCGRLAIIELDPSIRSPITLAARAPDTRRWRVEPSVAGNSSLALICDPPTAPVPLVAPIVRSNLQWELGPKSLRRIGPVCLIRHSDHFRTIERPDVCPASPPGHIDCHPVTGRRADEIKERERRRGQPCSSVCECL